MFCKLICFSEVTVVWALGSSAPAPPGSRTLVSLLQRWDCERVNGAGWLETNALYWWNPGKGWLYPRAQPSQDSLKLLDLLSILLILKENKLHKWDRWFLFVMTVAILSSAPRPRRPFAPLGFPLVSTLVCVVFLLSNIVQHGQREHRGIQTWTPGSTSDLHHQLWWPLWPHDCDTKQRSWHHSVDLFKTHFLFD